jgi:hypothetical protein
VLRRALPFCSIALLLVAMPESCHFHSYTSHVLSLPISSPFVSIPDTFPVYSIPGRCSAVLSRSVPTRFFAWLCLGESPLSSS